MKRKHWNRKGKGKGKKPKTADLSDGKAEADIVTAEDSAGGEEVKDGDFNSRMEVDTPESAGTDQAEKLSPEVVREKPFERKVQVVYGRVRVKLKSAKPVEAVPSALGAGIVVQTDKRCLEQAQLKSSQEKEKNGLLEDASALQKNQDKQEAVTGEVDEKNDSSPDIMLSALGNPPKKFGGLKIKSSKAPIASNSNVVSNSPGLIDEGTPPPKEQKVEKKESKYDKHELDSALAVITKVMQMDAAEPFNAPVDPLALGIPDYFNVIDTPMDFGTICDNIRSGTKYKNSKDVFKDVQYIWDNCYKYNNKGDYIVDLMKRVKKNFTKYWQSARLYNDQPHKNGGEALTSIGGDSSQARDDSTFRQVKIHATSTSSKAKIKKRPGFRRHKDGCLCAVCVQKRRRIEKDGKDHTRSVHDLTGTSDSNMAIDSKQEDVSPAESPLGGETSSNPDSQNPYSDADMDGRTENSKRENADGQPTSYIEGQDEEGANKIIQESSFTLEDTQQSDVNEEGGITYSQLREAVGPSILTPVDTQKDTMQLDEDPAIIQQRKLQEAEAKRRRIQALTESFNNPLLMDLCGTLFPDDSKSIWCGPHSIVRNQKGAFSSALNKAI